jgi:hypothetical protein
LRTPDQFSGLFVGLQIWVKITVCTIYNSINFWSENACERSANKVFTRPHTLPKSSDLRYRSRLSASFQWLKVV